MSDSAKSFGNVQGNVTAAHYSHTGTVSAGADRIERPESYTAVLQKQNVVLQSEVTDLQLQVRDLQLALVVEKALGVLNSRTRFLPSLGSAEAKAKTKKRP